jgi:hypothetical protein
MKINQQSRKPLAKMMDNFVRTKQKGDCCRAFKIVEQPAEVDLVILAVILKALLTLDILGAQLSRNVGLDKG